MHVETQKQPSPPSPTSAPQVANTEAQKIPCPPARCLCMHGPRNAAIGRAAGTGSSVADAVSRRRDRETSGEPHDCFQEMQL